MRITCTAVMEMSVIRDATIAEYSPEQAETKIAVQIGSNRKKCEHCYVNHRYNGRRCYRKAASAYRLRPLSVEEGHR